MVPIGLTLPLVRGKYGYFEQSYDTMSQIKSNILNLLRTNGGERRMLPTFSSGLKDIVFDVNNDDLSENIKHIISEKIAYWIPGVTVDDVIISLSETEKNEFKDSCKVYLKIKFSVNKQQDFVDFNFISSTI